ncbi:hypothetical protein B0H19DRAFT_1262050 [Mycena capillaripes]|nr:hypothetical protein B0H19DRAFT_1262050 [Mycena capillaripes]
MPAPPSAMSTQSSLNFHNIPSLLHTPTASLSSFTMSDKLGCTTNIVWTPGGHLRCAGLCTARLSRRRRSQSRVILSNPTQVASSISANSGYRETSFETIQDSYDLLEAFAHPGCAVTIAHRAKIRPKAYPRTKHATAATVMPANWVQSKVIGQQLQIQCDMGDASTATLSFSDSSARQVATLSAFGALPVCRHASRTAALIATAPLFRTTIISTSIHALRPPHHQIDTDAADFVRRIEVAFTLHPSTERPSGADPYGRHRAADKGIGQRMFEQAQSSSERGGRDYLIPAATKNTIALAQTRAANPFSHAPRHV